MFKEKRIGTGIDHIFLYVLIGLGAFIWSKFYIKHNINSLISAITITISIIAILEIKRKKRIKTENKELKISEEIINQFIFNTEEFAINFFYDLFKKRYNNIEIKENYLLVTTKKTTAVFFHMYLEKMNTEHLSKFYSSCKDCDKILILTAYGANDATMTTLLQIKKPIQIYDGFQVYNLIKEFNHYPQITVKLNKPKPKKIDLLMLAFEQKNTNKYLIIALILFIFAYLTRIKIYYIIFAIISCLMAFICYMQLHVKIINYFKNKYNK